MFVITVKFVIHEEFIKNSNEEFYNKQETHSNWKKIVMNLTYVMIPMTEQ